MKGVIFSELRLNMYFNMKIILTIITIIFMINPVAGAEIKYVITGNKAVGGSEIEYAMESNKESPESAILELYQSRGYWNCHVDIIDSGVVDGSKAVAISEGVRYSFADIDYAGLKHYESDLLISRCGDLSGRAASSAVLEDHIAGLLEFYSGNGYPYTRITAEDFDIDDKDHSVDLTLNVSEGPQVVIDTVIINGNKITEDYVIRREIELAPGLEFDKRRLDDSVNRINALGFVSVSDPPGLFYDARPVRGVLVFNVAEHRSSYINGVLGYIPPQGERKEYLNGLIDIVLGNIMGTGRKAGLYFESTDPESRQVRIAYTEPYFLGTPLDMSLRFNQVDRDSTFMKIEAETDFRYRLGARSDLNLSLSVERITPGAADLYPEERYGGYSAGLSFSGNWFDYPYNPRHGYSFGLGIRYIRRIYVSTETYTPPKPEVNRTAADLKGSTVFKTIANNYIFLSGGVAGITSDGGYLPASERFGIGGRKTVRGYIEGRFFGSEIAFLRSEWRMLAGRSGRFYFFCDNGYYHFNNRDGESVDDWLTGFGLGVASRTAIGVVVAEFAWGKDDSFGEGKFHFGVESRF
jgi:outer membrane protein assembly factor BamA